MQNFIVVAFPTNKKKNSVFGQFSSLPPSLPPPSKAQILFLLSSCRLLKTWGIIFPENALTLTVVLGIYFQMNTHVFPKLIQSVWFTCAPRSALSAYMCSWLSSSLAAYLATVILPEGASADGHPKPYPFFLEYTLCMLWCICHSKHSLPFPICILVSFALFLLVVFFLFRPRYPSSSSSFNAVTNATTCFFLISILAHFVISFTFVHDALGSFCLVPPLLLFLF